jgi:hypothetical protein
MWNKRRERGMSEQEVSGAYEPNNLPVLSRIECEGCGDQQIVFKTNGSGAEVAFKSLHCRTCKEDVPREKWSSLPEDPDVLMDESEVGRPWADQQTGREKTDLFKDGCLWTYQLDLELFDEDEHQGVIGDERAGWYLESVEFIHPLRFMALWEPHLLGKVQGGGPKVDPNTGASAIADWYASRIVLASVWVARRKDQRAKDHDRCPWMYFPQKENVHMDNTTLRWLANLLQVQRSFPATFKPIEQEVKVK